MLYGTPCKATRYKKQESLANAR